MRRLWLAGAVLLVLGVVYVAAWRTQPGTGQPGKAQAATQSAASRTTAVTSVARSCPPPVPDTGQAHVALIAVPAQAARAATAGTGSAVLSAIPSATARGRQPGKQPDAKPVTVSSPGSLSVVSAPRAAESGGTQLVATGSMAAGFEAEQATAAGVGTVSCVHPGADMWFVGTGEQDGASATRLYLMNTASMPASVDVSIITESGPRPGPNTVITVPPHQYVQQNLTGYARGSAALAVHVQTTSGQVAASVLEGSGSGAAWLPRASAPGTRIVIGGLTSAGGSARLFVAVPGDHDAQVKVTALTARGKFQPFGTSAVDSPASAVSSFALTSLGTSAASVVLSSGVPITAAVLVPGNGIGSFSTGASPVTGQGVVAGNPAGGGYTVGLVLSATVAAARAGITVIPSGSTQRPGQPPQGSPHFVTVLAGRTVAVTVRPPVGGQPFAIVITPRAGSGPLYAARVITSGGGLSSPVVSVLPVPSAPTSIALPPVRDAYAAVLP
jgi:hypothetical protein